MNDPENADQRYKESRTGEENKTDRQEIIGKEGGRGSPGNNGEKQPSLSV